MSRILPWVSKKFGPLKVILNWWSSFGNTIWYQFSFSSCVCFHFLPWTLQWHIKSQRISVILTINHPPTQEKTHKNAHKQLEFPEPQKLNGQLWLSPARVSVNLQRETLRFAGFKKQMAENTDKDIYISYHGNCVWWVGVVLQTAELWSFFRWDATRKIPIYG